MSGRVDRGGLRPLKSSDATPTMKLRATRYRTISHAWASYPVKGFEVMRTLRKGQAAIFNLTRDILGEARLVERAFGLGACSLTEAVQLVGERLEAA